MASVSTADTWRESGIRTGPRAPRPEAAEYVSRIPRPPVPPRARPAGPMRSTDIPPMPEHLARLERRRSDDDRSGHTRPPVPHRSAAVPPVRPGRSERARHPQRDERDAPRRAPRPAEPRAAGRVVDEPERGSRLRGWAAALAVLVITLAGAAADSYLGPGLGIITLGTLTAAAGLGTLLVRRRDLTTMVVTPPLVFIVAAVAVNAVFASVNLAGLATLLVRGFPTMAVATGVALVLALVRWAAGR
ncbi:DUF6542 domain-containing protein [Geodermatophilus sabuli]|uniref:DUF6542 domain-containing protein n=1 Tax=Geodermatophilus sabuli TaxID=1564158 RepID=A0A285EJA4_9ACTN|nr:DUF6542 domain-containing protein [Geodermatophilus sabuli]MBB3083120.1 hypothetical protein [Geodermatophilus sabuli]SNX98116.1 hypothetical protein SAMN06893097_109196 [Geodermatophilus sabuli]